MDKAIIKKNILEEIRNPEIYLKEVVNYIENNVEDAFNIACRKNLSINEWKPDASFGEQLNQKTVLLIVRMFDLWETALIDILNKQLNKRIKGIKVEHTHDSKGDLTIYLPNGEELIFEIKTTQAKDSWTGATHSSSKYDDYILISYNINKDLKLKKGLNKGFITELAVLVWDGITKDLWSGEPSEKSSWTSLKIPAEIAKSIPEIIVIGRLNPKEKWCEVERVNLN